MRYFLKYRIEMLFIFAGLLSIVLLYSCSDGGDSSPSAPTTQGNPTPPYDCSADVYRCSDFATQEDSQIVFDFCMNAGAGDIHRLDWNNNQIPCEEFDRQNEPTVSIDPTPTPRPAATATPTPRPVATATPIPTPRPTATPIPTGFSCTPRKTCGQMSSCAEAYYQLNTCGYSSLDSDKDGVPCESICPGG